MDGRSKRYGFDGDDKNLERSDEWNAVRVPGQRTERCRSQPIIGSHVGPTGVDPGCSECSRRRSKRWRRRTYMDRAKFKRRITNYKLRS